jgi:hypothetical protein
VIIFDLIFTIETNIALKKIEFYIDYPSDYIEFININNSNMVFGKNWTLTIE